MNAYHPEPDFNKWGWKLEDGYLGTKVDNTARACKELIDVLDANVLKQAFFVQNYVRVVVVVILEAENKRTITCSIFLSITCML